MRKVDYDCRHSLRDLARRQELDAILATHLELHLKRCARCQDLAEQLAVVEAGPGEPPPMDQERQKAIYNRLLPVVNELTAADSPLRRPRHRPWNVWMREYGLLGLAACAAAVMLVLTFWPTAATQTSSAGPAAIAAHEVQATPLPTDANGPFSLPSTVDHLEGSVAVDGRSAEAIEQFDVKPGTRISTDIESRMGFRMGDTAKVALMGQAEWEVTRLSPTAIGLRLTRGRLAIEFDGTIGQTMEVETPDSIVRVKGTTFTVEVLELGGTRVSVVEGLVEVVPKRGPNLLAVELAVDQSCTIPGPREVIPLSEEQRALAAGLPNEHLVEDTGTRVVRFDGSPEKVKVEVDGRVVGITPLMVRVPSGPVAYRLSAPGMAAVEGTLDAEGEHQAIVYAMEPAPDFGPEALEIIRITQPRTRPDSPARHAATNEADTTASPRWSLFQRAKSAVAAGDLRYAIGLLERAVDDASGEKLIFGLVLLAECHAALGDYLEAAAIYERIVDLASNNAEGQNARYEVGRLAMDKLGDLPRARAAFTAYVASTKPGPLREDAYYSLCEVAGKEGNHNEALRCFNEFLRSFPGGHREADARLWRGALYQQDSQCKWADAERDLQAFIRAKPNHPRTEEARYRLVIGRFKLGDERGAMRMIEEYELNHPKGSFKTRLDRIRAAIVNSGQLEEAR